MNKNIFDKSANFFKKEGFYVILFICLCIVAVCAVLSTRKANNLVKNPTVIEENNTQSSVTPENKVAIKEDNSVDVPNNALQVKESSKSTEASKNNKTSAVSSTANDKFVNPVQGTLGKAYTTDLVYCKVSGSYLNDPGIEIKAKVGDSVSAVLDGKVVEVDNDKSKLGQYVVIDHLNGLKTTYANLNEKINVKVGDNVKKGAVIGTIGETRQTFSEEDYGSHLHFRVMNGNDYVDPAKYVNYSVK
jgi:murein DD-endopeptidase MepM/ murein hydrolase activator NlpD